MYRTLIACVTLTLLIGLTPSAEAQTRTQVSLGVGLGTNAGLGVVDVDLSTPLDPGVFNVNGDGTVVQFGYFSAATSGDPFAGDWVALTGQGGLNVGFATTSVGDDASNWTNFNEASGYFYTNLEFISTDPTRFQGLPGGGAIMAIRFYNGLSIAGSTHFNTVSNPSWTWMVPTPSTGSFAIYYDSDAGTLWQDAANPGATTIVIPEPAAYAALLGLATLGLVAMRRRRS